MADINEITYDGILKKMMQAYTAQSGFEPDAASDIAIRLRVLAAQIHSTAMEGQWLLRQMFFDTATGEYLDRHARMRGICRSVGDKARGILTFTLDTTLNYRLMIPAGTVCTMGADSALRFVTLEDGIINIGNKRISVDAECETSGLAGNAAAGSINCILAPPAAGLRVSNAAVFHGGTADEDDEGLRGRIASLCSRPSNGTNAAYYQSVALSTDGVASACVLPRNRGRGTVDVYIAGMGKKASSETINALQSRFDSEREINVDVQVYSATVKPCAVKVALKSEFGYEFATQKAKATRIIQDFFNHMTVGEDLRYNQLGNCLLAEIDGLVDYDFEVSGLCVAIADTELATLGTLSVTEWSD